MFYKRKKHNTAQDHLKDLLNRVYIGNLESIFDANAIWRQQYSRNKLDTTLNGEPLSGGLYTALKSCPLPIPKMDLQRNRCTTIDKYFTDVVLFIHPDIWDTQILGGTRIYTLAAQLTGLHVDEFKNTLLRDRKPRYCIMPANSGVLEKDNDILIQFGESVFIPDEQDEQIAELTYRYDGQIGYHLDPWIFFDRNGNRSERPIGLYKGQRCISFAEPTSPNSHFSPPKWFDDPEKKKRIMLIFNNNTDDINSGKAYALPKNAVTYSEKPSISVREITTYSFTSGDKRIALELRPLHIDDVHINTDHQGNFIDDTYIGGMGNARLHTKLPGVILTHIALPEQSMIAPKFDRWSLSFDHNGQPVNSLSSAKAPFITIALDQGGLCYRTHQMQKLEPLENITSLNVDDLTFNFLPMQESIRPEHAKLLPSPQSINDQNNHRQNHYKALLALPAMWRRTYLNFPEQRTIMLGRAIEESHHHLLSVAGSLSSNGKPCENALHDIAFSRRHAELTYEEDAVILAQLSETAPITVLDSQMQRTDLLIPGDQRTIRLTHGHAFILGCYTYQVTLPQIS